MIFENKIGFSLNGSKKGLIVRFVLFSFILLLVLSTSIKYHLNTEHKLRIDKLNEIKLNIVYQHLEKEDAIMLNNSLKLVIINDVNNSLNELLKIRQDNYLISFFSKGEYKEIEDITKQFKLFEMLIGKVPSKELNFKHDIIFKSIVDNINKLHSHLLKRLKRQLNIVDLIQNGLISLIVVWLFITILTLKNIRKDRINLLLQKETILKELKYSNFFLEKAQDLSKIGFFNYSFSTNIWTASDFILDLMKYKKGENILSTWVNIIHPEDKNLLTDILYNKTDNTNFSLNITYRIINPSNGKIHWIHHISKKIEEESKGNILSVLGVIQDVTQQKSTAITLENSRQKYKNLFEQNPIALWEEDYSKIIQILNKKKKEVDDLEKYMDNNPDFVLECMSSGKISNVNKAVLDLFEVSNKEELAKHLYTTFTKTHKSVYKKGLIAVPLRGESFSSEVSFVTKKGKVIDTLINAVLIKNENKVIFTIIDSTKQKKSEKLIKEGQDKLNEAITITNLGTFSFNAKTGTFETSTIFDTIIGVKNHGLKNIEEFVKLSPPDDCQYIDKLFNDTNVIIIEKEFRVLRPKDNKIIWILLHANKKYDKNFILLSIEGTIQDITKRKKAEEKLKQSDAILKKLDSIVIIVNNKAEITFISPSVKDILGYDYDELLGDGWWKKTFDDPKLAEKTKERTALIVKNKLKESVNTRLIKTKGGLLKWISWHRSNIIEDSLIFQGIDITEKQEKDIQIKSMVETAQSAIVIADSNGLIVEWNKKACTIFGYSKNEILNKPISIIIPKEYKERHSVGFKKAIERGYLNKDKYSEIKGLTKKGTAFFIEMSLSTWQVGGNNYYCAFIIDISDRQREAKIKDVIFKISKFANSITNLEKLLPYVRETLQNVIDTTNFYIALYNVKNDSFNIPYRVDEEDINRDDYLKHFKKGKTLSGYVFETKKPLLSTSTLAESLYKIGLIKEEGVKSKCWLGVPLIINNEVIGVMAVQNYTNKNAFKEKEVALLELIAANISQVVRQAQNYKQIRLLNQALIQSPESVVVTNIEGDIEYTNPAFTKLSGYTAKEAIGKNPRILKSGDHLDAFYKKMWDTISRGEMWRGEFINKRKDGSKYLVSATVSAVKNRAGETTHYIGVEEDITEKRQLERDYLNAFIDAQEQEKQSFGEDLHDGISQILAAEGMYVDILLQHENLAPKKVKKYLEKIKEHNLNAINDARRIAHGLMSKQLKQKGLLKSIEHICDDYNHSRNITFNFFNDKLEEKDINKTIKTNIYRVCQEITTNIVRHSGATKASISFSKTVTNELKLVIEDNGAGIDFEKIKSENRGTGLKNIERRITLLSGKLDLESTINEGTKYTIIIPLDSSI